jgi:predicted acetyltransferase
MAKRRSFEFRPPVDAAECRALAAVIRQSFASFGRPPEFMERFVEHVGRENLRLVKQGGRIVGGLGIFHFRQWFGGRSIPSAGITAVAMAPEVRGTGLGTQSMRALVRELHQAGLPLSVLYPASVPFYRKVGYEPAGERVVGELETSRIGVSDHTCTMRIMAPSDRKAVRALHRVYGRNNSGNLDRTARCWSRLLEFAKEEMFTYVIAGPGQRGDIEGYVVYTQQHRPGGLYDLHVRDYAFVTPAAGRRLLTFFADHGTVVQHVTYEGAYHDALTALTRLNNHKVRTRLPWALRVVNVAASLRDRGYPAGTRAELHLEVRDPLLADNNGRFVLRVQNGKGRVREGGRGHFKLDVLGLAPLFSGHLSAAQLALAGMIEGRASDLALADALFSGPQPWINDHF